MKIMILTIALIGASAAHADIAAVEKAFKACAENAMSTYEINGRSAIFNSLC